MGPIGGAILWESVGGGFAFRAVRLFHDSEVMCAHEVLYMLAAAVLCRCAGGHECLSVPTPGLIVACVGFPLCLVLVVVTYFVAVVLCRLCAWVGVVVVVALCWWLVVISTVLCVLLLGRSGGLLWLVAKVVSPVDGGVVLGGGYCRRFVVICRG